MKGRYRIREMTPSDVETVAQLCRLFEPVSTTIFRGVEAEDVTAWVREHISLQGWAGFVAEVESEVVGFALCKDMEKDPRGFVFPQARETLYLLYLAVDEAFRGQGIARALIHASEELARKWGRTGLLLDVAEDNPALSLYRRLGFKRLGAQIFLRKEI